MQLNTGGYSRVQYNPEELRGTAKQVAKVLPKLMQELGANTVAVTGKSGLALAFATLMLIDFPLMVVRKRGEMTHGSPIEGPEGHVVGNYIILDDFISSGTTVRTMIDQINEYQEVNWEYGFIKPVCVGVLEYKKERGAHVGEEDYIDCLTDNDGNTVYCYGSRKA